MNYLLDTCVISELVASKPSPKVIEWIDSIDEERLYLSVITVGEVKKGVARLAHSKRRNALEAWLEQQLLARFAGRLLPIDTGVMLLWGDLVADLEKSGRPMPAMDSLIAATALKGDLCLATRNEGDFANTGVAVLNPLE